MLHWEGKDFADLSAKEIYRIIALREQVFIVEQNEVYLDADGKDFAAWHLCGWVDASKETLVGYARVLFPTNDSPELRFGRVIVSEMYRGCGYARQLVNRIFEYIQESPYKNKPIFISAQEYLVKFYRDFGFSPFGEVYYEGKIPHINMKKEALIK